MVKEGIRGFWSIFNIYFHMPYMLNQYTLGNMLYIVSFCTKESLIPSALNALFCLTTFWPEKVTCVWNSVTRPYLFLLLPISLGKLCNL